MIETRRPKLELLGDDLIKKIIHGAFIILEKQGVFVENKEALELFQEAGLKARKEFRMKKGEACELPLFL